MSPNVFSVRSVSYLLAGAFLLLVLLNHLLVPMLAGLLVFELVHMIAGQTRILRLMGHKARLTALLLIACTIILLISLISIALYRIFIGESEFVPETINKIIATINVLRPSMPPWILNGLPDNYTDWMHVISHWAGKNLSNLQALGTRAGHIMGQTIIAMIISGLLSLRIGLAPQAPLSSALTERAACLALSFRRVVFAQVRISMINTFFTWCYLGMLLPLFGAHIPLLKTLLLLTFIAGLLPVVGNLISNTAIILVSLSVSPTLAVSSLGFLVIIHKLEYFLNAMIVGSQIHARAWEILLAMLLMESCFGLPGLVAAPILYAYIKQELTTANLI